MAKVTYIPGEVANAAVDENGKRLPVTRTQHIFDDALNKPQSQVNTEITEAISEEVTRAQEAESGLNTRLQTVEQLAEISVGGGDIGIGTAADFESDDPEDLAKVPTVGAMLGGANDGVYDISARHNGTKYADLAAALGTNGINVPVGVRKGGMSVKFVQSSDNKYVQYRLMADTFSITESDWQGVDKEPEGGSTNLIMSQSVYNLLQKINELCAELGIEQNIILSDKFAVTTNGNHKISADIVNGERYFLYIKSSSPLGQSFIGLNVWNNDDNVQNAAIGFDDSDVSKGLFGYFTAVADGNYIDIYTAGSDTSGVVLQYALINVTESTTLKDIYDKLGEGVLDSCYLKNKEILTETFLDGYNYSDSFILLDTLPDRTIGYVNKEFVASRKYRIAITSNINLWQTNLFFDLYKDNVQVYNCLASIGNEDLRHTQHIDVVAPVDADAVGLYIKGQQELGYIVASVCEYDINETVGKAFDKHQIIGIGENTIHNGQKGSRINLKIYGKYKINSVTGSIVSLGESGSFSFNFGSVNVQIPLSSPLNYFNEQYYDTIEKVNGVYKIARRCGRMILNGTQTWNIGSSSPYRFYIPTDLDIAYDVLRTDRISNGYNDIKDGTVYIEGLHICFCKDGITSQSGVNNFFANYNVTVIYPKANVVYEDLPASIVSLLDSLMITDNNTFTSISEASIIGVEYQSENGVSNYLEKKNSTVLPLGVHNTQNNFHLVLEKGGQFDSYNAESPCVFWDSISMIWRMVYVGYSYDENNVLYGTICGAYSNDLFSWTKQENPVFSRSLLRGEYDYGSVTAPFVFIKNGIYHLLYCGCSEKGYEAGQPRLCMATATTWGDFTRITNNPIVDIKPNTWRNRDIFHPNIFEANGKYYLFFNSRALQGSYPDSGVGDERIGYAVSMDLVHWNVCDTPVLYPTDGGIDSYLVGDPYLVDIGDDNVYMFYYGSDGVMSYQMLAYTTKLKFPEGWEKYGKLGDDLLVKDCVVYKGGKQYHFVGAGGRIGYYLNE